MIVEDDGGGLPDGFDPAQGESLGLQIVHTLVTDDLKGQLEIVSYEELGPPSENLEGGERGDSGRSHSDQANSDQENGDQEDSDRQGDSSLPEIRSGTRAIVSIPKRPLKAS